MSTSVIIHEVEYPAEISGVLQNPKWDRRDTKAITLEMTHETAVSLFVDGLAWSIKQVNTYPVFDEQGQPTGETTTETETLRAEKADAELAAKILLGEAE